MVEEGSRFPDFHLKDQDGNPVSLDDIKGSPAIIYFYPKDDTSGCTVEACAFRDDLPSFEGIRVFGVSPDDERSHKKFQKKYGLNFTLIADPEHALCEAVGIWVEKSMYGRKYMGVERTTFLLDKDGVVKKVWRKVKPDGHSAEVLAATRS